MYGARARETPEDITEREIRREIRTVLPDIFSGFILLFLEFIYAAKYIFRQEMRLMLQARLQLYWKAAINWSQLHDSSKSEHLGSGFCRYYRSILQSGSAVFASRFAHLTSLI